MGTSEPEQFANPERERELILEALLDLCSSRGYRNVDLAQLLARAELDEATFHRHFATLDDCFLALYRPFREEFLRRLEQAIADQPTWLDRMRAAAYFLLDWVLEDERRTQVGLIDVRAADERAQRLLTESVERVFDLIDEGRLEGRRAAGSSPSLTRATAEAVGGGVFNQLITAVERGTISEAAVPELMYSAVLPYLGPAAAAKELGAERPVSKPTPRPAARARRS